VSRPPLDPYAILGALEQRRVGFVLVGALARVLHGSGELADGVDITPSLKADNLARLQVAIDEIRGHRPDGRPVDLAGIDFDAEPLLHLQTDHGQLGLVPVPAGTRGYDDVRRGSGREALGRGLRVSVAGPGDLLRMLNALGREADPVLVDVMRHVTELEGRGISR
jgi:hypothetical protein